ncbi:MAG: DHHW family protein, partial [Bacilli bacterium]|nr:DHHW family protein [Bacilli bacterium]
EMLSILDENISLSEYIDIFSCLNVDDYYLTDIHWRQDKLVKVTNQIFDGMNDSYRIILEDYEIHKLSPFYGAYYGQFPLKVRPDELVYLTNETTEKALVYNYYTSSYTKVYDEEKIDSADGYSVYLEGPVPLITIENPLCDNDDELYIFRDSFGSSLAPLLIERYKKIYLIDLRYASEDLIAENIDYKEGQRVLFLYSTTIINNSSTLL